MKTHGLDPSPFGVNRTQAAPLRISPALIGVDWGTTHLRGYRIGPEGQLLERRQSTQGISSVRPQEFSAVLTSLISDWFAEPNSNADSMPLPVLLCGMVGSRQGWRETPYVPCPAGLDEVIRNLVRIETAQGPAWIVGGVSTQDARGRYDVMRGEETQIFGASESGERGLLVAPGTHSKWALVNGGRIEHFTTYLTGELFALLQKHSSLGWRSAARETEPPEIEREGKFLHEQMFLNGVDEVRVEPDLVHTLFSVRTRALFEECHSGSQAAYLSGILVGNEVLNGLRRYPDEAITVIASDTLAPLYRVALAACGRPDARLVDGEHAVVRGLWQVWQLKQQGNLV